MSKNSAAPLARYTLNVGGQEHDVSRFMGAVGAFTGAVARSASNPLAIKPLQDAQRAAALIAQMPGVSPAIIDRIRPITEMALKAAQATNEVIKLRMEQRAKLTVTPSIPVPLSISLAANTTSGTFIVKNPYLGSGATGFWAVCGMSTGPIATLTGIRFTSLKFASVDYAVDGQSGITYPVTGAATTPGIPLYVFASDAFLRAEQVWKPWNLGSSAAAVMSDVAQVSCVLRNDTASAFAGDVVFWVQASPCGFAHLAQTNQALYRPSVKAIQMARRVLASGWPDAGTTFDPVGSFPEANPYYLADG